MGGSESQRNVLVADALGINCENVEHGGSMNGDQFWSRADIAIGRMKEFAGFVLRRPALENRGKHEQVTGRARASYGNAVAAVLRRAH
jgi:uncharacterized protein YjbJ (UPF0337 family)